MKRTRRITVKESDEKLQFIEALNLRNISYCKRKRGFIKKAMELSVLCGQQISLVIFDAKKNKLVSYNTENFSHKTAVDLHTKHMREQNSKFESYSDQNY